MPTGEFLDVDLPGKTLWLNSRYRGLFAPDGGSLNDAPVLKALMYPADAPCLRRSTPWLEGQGRNRAVEKRPWCGRSSRRAHARRIGGRINDDLT